MSEIKTVLNFFDKNNGLDGVIKDLKEVKKLQASINKQKGAIGSDNLKERTAALKEITRLQKQLDNQRKKTVKTAKESVGIEKELVRVQEQDRKVKQKLKVARSDKFRQLQENNLALQRQNKLVKDDIRENSKLGSVYDRQSAKLNRLRKELKNLILTEGEGSIKTKKLALEVGKLDTKLKAADASAGQFQRNVGNYPKGIKGAIGALKNFAGALGITAGIGLLVRGVKDTILTFKDFEESLSSLSSITGATGKDLEFYEEQAARIGETTTLSASQAVEAFKLIGSAKPELLANKEALVGVTEQAILLAEAAGLELPEAASSLANALNQFNLPAEESGRVINALAAGSKFGAAAIPELSEAITKFGVAAASSNISIEESIGAVELLAEKGIAGAEAGTKLRNVFGKLDIAKSLPPKAAKQLAKFGVNTDIVSDSTLTLKERLTELSKIQDDATALTFVFGEQNKIAGQAVLQNVERIDELTQAVTGTSTAIEQAGINVDNLEGDMKSLNSVVESVQIAIGKKLQKSLRSTVKGVTNFIRWIKENNKLIVKWIKGIVALAAGFTAYRIAVALSNKESKISIFLSKADAVARKALAVINGVLTGKIKLATIAQKALNLAQRANPIGLLIGLLTAAAAALFFYKDAAEDATDAQLELNEAQQSGADILEGVKTLEQRAKTINRLNKVQLENLLGDIDTQIAAEEDKAAALIELNENSRGAIERAEREHQETLAELRKEFDAADNDIDRVQIQFTIDQNEAFRRSVEREQEGITTIENEEARKRLDRFKIATEARLALLKRLSDEEKRLAGGGKDDGTLAKLRAEAKRNEQKELDDFLNAKEKSENDFFETQRSKEEQEIRAVEEHYFLLLSKAEEFDVDSTQLEEDRQAKLDAIRQKWRDKEAEDEAKRLAELKKQYDDAQKEIEKAEEEAAKLKREQQQEVIEQSKEAVDVALEDLTRESEAKIESLERQINAEEDFISDNENLSAREIEFRRKKAAELEVERIKEQERLERLAKTQAFFDLVAAFASSGDGEGAVGKAATTMAAAEVISGGFHDGGYTGEGNEYTVAGVTHKGEFVNTKKQTDGYGMKGWTAKDFDNAITDGYFNQFADAGAFADQNSKFLSVQNNEVGYDMKRVEDAITKGFDNLPNNMPTSDFSIEGGYFVKKQRSKGKTLITKKKLG